MGSPEGDALIVDPKIEELGKEQLEVLRDELLGSLRIGKQAQKYKTSKLLLDKFIDKLLIKLKPIPLSSSQDWKVGDKVSVKMPSGVIIPEMIIRSIQPKQGVCKVHDPSTNTHFSAELANLSSPLPDNKPDGTAAHLINDAVEIYNKNPDNVYFQDNLNKIAIDCGFRVVQTLPTVGKRTTYQILQYHNPEIIEFWSENLRVIAYWLRKQNLLNKGNV
jgi:hypothetical protein